jgi:transposase
MRANMTSIRKMRSYSESFKRQLVSEFESGRYSVLQLEKLHGISNNSIYKWIYKYSTYNEKGYRVIEMKKSSTQKVKELQRKVAELEQIVGQKQIAIDYLEKMIELAKAELKIDIKKNFSTPPSDGSSKTKQK